MLREVTGDIVESDAEALVNTVNTVGVMGKGVALRFKKAFPNNFEAYRKACEEKRVQIGKMFVFIDEDLLRGKKIIINFPTKTDWRKPSEYDYIEQGLIDLANVIEQHRPKSVAIPPLGVGNGGLEWSKVRQLIYKRLEHAPCEIYLYQPSDDVKEALAKERVKLTPARAMLLAVLYDLARSGEFVSEFACEKICYFLQRLGATRDFKMTFKNGARGPHSSQTRALLRALNGSYLAGYSEKEKNPFAPLRLEMDAERQVVEFLARDSERHALVENAKRLLSGFCSPLALEALALIDSVANAESATDVETIRRKFRERVGGDAVPSAKDTFIQKAIERLQEAGLLSLNQ